MARAERIPRVPGSAAGCRASERIAAVELIHSELSHRGPVYRTVGEIELAGSRS